MDTATTDAARQPSPVTGSAPAIRTARRRHELVDDFWRLDFPPVGQPWTPDPLRVDVDLRHEIF